MGTYIEARIIKQKPGTSESEPWVNVRVTQPGNSLNPEAFTDQEGNFKIKTQMTGLPLLFEHPEWNKKYSFIIPGSVAIGAGWLITVYEEPKYNPMWFIGGGLLASFIIWKLTKKKKR